MENVEEKVLFHICLKKKNLTKSVISENGGDMSLGSWVKVTPMVPGLVWRHLTGLHRTPTSTSSNTFGMSSVSQP